MSDDEHENDYNASDDESEVDNNNIKITLKEDDIDDETKDAGDKAANEDDDNSDSEDESVNNNGDSESEEEDDDDDSVLGDFEEAPTKKSVKKGKRTTQVIEESFDDMIDDDDDDNNDEEEEDEHYLQKFDENISKQLIMDFHPELHQHNYEEIEALSRVVRNEMGYVVDPLHNTLPFLTKYEKARILGERSKQLNSGAQSFIPVDEGMLDGYLIALKELEQKKIPFIIKRPLPNGGCEYWKLKDLEILL